MPRDFFEEINEAQPKNLSGGIFTVYQKIAESTAIYPKKMALPYTSLGLAGEAGELANKIKKIIRDDLPMTPLLKEDLMNELGDCLWYISAMCTELGTTLTEVADKNLRKLLDRKERGKLGGSGDDR